MSKASAKAELTHDEREFEPVFMAASNEEAARLLFKGVGIRWCLSRYPSAAGAKRARDILMKESGGHISFEKLASNKYERARTFLKGAILHDWPASDAMRSLLRILGDTVLEEQPKPVEDALVELVRTMLTVAIEQTGDDRIELRIIETIEAIYKQRTQLN